MKRIAALGLLLVLAGCGDEQGLTPKPGHLLPVQPETAPTRPDADALLTPPAHVRPGRTDELLVRSVPRQPDRFDLPPH